VGAQSLAPLPGDVDFTVGARPSLSGLTAWQGLFEPAGFRRSAEMIQGLITTPMVRLNTALSAPLTPGGGGPKS
jgi:hypothetical protein